MLGALIGAGASLLGGILGNKSQEEANEKNAAMQREFAQNSIQWKAADAKKAGIHPLYGIGAQTITPQASYVGDTSLPNALAQTGQNIGSSIDATRTAPQKLTAYAQAAQTLELERASLQNDLLRTQIAEAAARTASAPPFPAAVDPYNMPGQPQSGVKHVPMERIMSPHNAFTEGGPVTDLGYTNTAHGGLAPVMSKDAKDRLEEDTWGTLGWNVRNRLIPMMTPYSMKGYVFDPVSMQYVPASYRRRYGR